MLIFDLSYLKEELLFKTYLSNLLLKTEKYINNFTELAS